jgi:hypothetical protein
MSEDARNQKKQQDQSSKDKGFDGFGWRIVSLSSITWTFDVEVNESVTESMFWT